MSRIALLMARSRGLMLLLVPLLLWACGDESNPEAPSTPTVVSFDFQVDNDLQTALGDADNALVRVTFDGAQAVEQTVDFSAGDGRVEVDLASGGNALVVVELRSGTDVLFRGSKHVTISASQTNSVAFAVTPEVAELRVEEMGIVEMLGDPIQLEGSARFATGQVIPGLALEWSTTDDNVELGADGTFRAFRNGTFDVSVAAGELSATGQVEVEAEAQITDVSPAVVPLGEEVMLELVGVNLYGATGIEMCGTATVDTESLAIADDGRSATVSVRWERFGAGSDALQSGAHCVRLVTPQGEPEINVQLNEPIITQLVTSHDVLQIEKGETAQIELEVYGENNTRLTGQPVQWSSSASSVISVDQTGMVKGLKGGTAVITAQVLNATAQVEVFVNAVTGGSATISGVVRTTATTPGIPVEGAMVAIGAASGAAVTTTDEDGAYSFTGLPQGAYELHLADMPNGFADEFGEVRKTYVGDGASKTIDFNAISVYTVTTSESTGEGSLAEAFDALNGDRTLEGIEIESGLASLSLDPGALFFTGNQDITIVGNGATIDASGCICVPMAFLGGGHMSVRDLTVMGGGMAEAGLVFSSWNHQGGNAEINLQNVSVQNVATYGLVVLDIDVAGPLSTSGGFSSVMSSMIGYEEAQLNAAVDPESNVKDGATPITDMRMTFTQPNLTIGTGVGLDITMDNVTADGNAMGIGTAGTVIAELGGGDVNLTISNSSFSRNGSIGLQVIETGPGSLNGSIDSSVFDNNGFGWVGGSGIFLFEEGTGNLDVALSNSTVSRSGDDGVDALETGAGWLELTLAHNEIYSNWGDGVLATELGDGDFMFASTGDVFRNNDVRGLSLYEESDGHFTANIMNGSFMNNNDHGMDLNEYDDGGMTVMMSNVDAMHSDEDGINIYSEDDDDVDVTFTNVDASKNGDDGIYISTYDDYFDVMASFNNVTTNDNEQDGIDIEVEDNDLLDVVLNSVWSNNNGETGIEIDTSDNDGNLSVTGSNVWANNSRDGNGVMVYLDEEDLLFDVSNLTIDGTVSDEGLYIEVDDGSLDIMLQNAVITDSYLAGIYLYIHDDLNGSIEDSQIRDNRFWGLYVDDSDGGTLSLINTVISGNTPGEIENHGSGVIS